jgi:acetylornithine deacetylase
VLILFYQSQQAAVDEYQGRKFDSYGVGLRYLLTHGYAADYHILGEPTGMTPWVGQMGTVWAKVTTYGTFAHTAFASSAINAIDEMWLLWKGLDSWIEEFKKKNVFMGVAAEVNRAAINGGLPWRAARTPNVCNMYIDIRFPPDQYPTDIQREFKSVVSNIAENKLKMPVDIEFYVSRPGTLIPSDHPVITSIVDAHEKVTGETTTPSFTVPFCTDAIDANRLGIPTVNYGAAATRSRDKGKESSESIRQKDTRSSEGEFIYIDDMVTCSQVYGVAAINLTNTEIPDLKAKRFVMPGVIGL